MEAFHLRLADSFGTWNWSDAFTALCVLSHGVPWFIHFFSDVSMNDPWSQRRHRQPRLMSVPAGDFAFPLMAGS